MNEFGVLFLIIVLIILLIINAKYNSNNLLSRNGSSRRSRNSLINSTRKSNGKSGKSWFSVGEESIDDQENSRNNGDGRDGQDSRDGRNGQDSRDGRDGQDSQDSRDGQGNRDGRDGQGNRDGRDGRGNRDGRDGRGNRAGRDGIDGIDNKGFQPKLIKKNNSSNQNKVYDLSIASSSNGSSVTCTTNTSSDLKPPRQDKDYYYLGDPKDTQLYHIFKNVYTFDEAKEECVKRNGVLADPQQLANAYTSGANWCSWGWTGDGTAYLPSKTKDCNKDIGLLNGKKIDPYLRLGTNCYGVPQ